MFNPFRFANGFDTRSELRSIWTYVCVGVLVLLGAGTRLLDIAPNFSAVAAVAMAAGFLFRSRGLAIATVLASMGLSDLVIGGHDWRVMLSVYLCVCVPVFFTHLLGQRPSVLRVAGCAAFGAVIFFVVTNLTVWACSGMYEQTLSGLTECYTMALPFFRMTLLGDVNFALAIFGVLYAAERIRDARALATA